MYEFGLDVGWLRTWIYVTIGFGLTIFIPSFSFQQLFFKNFLDCNVSVYSGDTEYRGGNENLIVANLLQVPPENDYGKKQWLAARNYRGNFILNLGCSDDSYSAVELINLFGHGWSTNRFKVFLRWDKTYVCFTFIINITVWVIMGHGMKSWMKVFLTADNKKNPCLYKHSTLILWLQDLLSLK